MNYRQPTQRMVSFLAISALALGLAACGKKDEEQTVGQKLDAAVFDAYGWPHDLTDEEILARLLALNLERAGKK